MNKDTVEVDKDCKVSETVLKNLFLEARSQNGYLDRPVSDQLLTELYDIVKMGPTSTNCLPARFLFVRDKDSKNKLMACVPPQNKPKIEQAPVTVIIGMDLNFIDKLPRLFPHMDMRPYYSSHESLIPDTAFRNSSLQGAYLILAARALGLDCGPMSGFDPKSVNETFWGDTNVKTNFICTLGYGDKTKVFPRLPRLSFDEACKLL